MWAYGGRLQDDISLYLESVYICRPAVAFSSMVQYCIWACLSPGRLYQIQCKSTDSLRPPARCPLASSVFHHVMHLPTSCTPAPLDAATFTNDIMDYNDRISMAIADLDSQEFPNCGATAKKYDLVRTTLWRRHTNRSNNRILASPQRRLRKSSTWSYWAFSSKRHPPNSCDREKYRRRDTWRPVRKELGYAIYTQSLTSPQKYVHTKYRQSARESRICPNVSAILWAGMSIIHFKNDIININIS